MPSTISPADYPRMLEESYAAVADRGVEQGSRLEFLADHIFDFTTHESDASELFASKALEVSAAISARTTFEYIEKPEDRIWYLLMLNMPFFSEKTDCGTSIRGSWWWPHDDKAIKLNTCGLYLDGDQHADPAFELADWIAFMAAVNEFARKKDD